MIVITDSGGETPPVREDYGVVSSYVDLPSGLRIWYLHAEDPLYDLADATTALDRFSRSGIPPIPGATVKIPNPDGGPPAEGPLEDLLAMAEIGWTLTVARELGLTAWAVELARQLDALASGE